ncbi:FAD:protein FMN transferase [Microbacterium sp. CJ88]|uniref:FAD:protein FMN transferase n=1 Tax=Microbacterium sp. CJ88 TaxID=3445672 RepID=UPI003F65E626
MATTVHVFDTMGTAVSVRSGDRLDPEAMRSVESVFDAFDRRFSLYRPDSELSRIARGDLALSRASGAVRDCYAEALEWGRRSDGAFTPHRPDGIVDLSGIVKADAIAAAGGVLDGAGIADWLLNAGGDILARGDHAGEAWRLGIVDPSVRDALLCTVTLGGLGRALATSGTAERGEHIWRHGPADYRQVSVVAGDIVTADVLATAILAGGRRVCDSVAGRFDVDILTVDGDGEMTATTGIRAALGMTAPST